MVTSGDAPRPEQLAENAKAASIKEHGEPTLMLISDNWRLNNAWCVIQSTS